MSMEWLTPELVAALKEGGAIVLAIILSLVLGGGGIYIAYRWSKIEGQKIDFEKGRAERESSRLEQEDRRIERLTDILANMNTRMEMQERTFLHFQETLKQSIDLTRSTLKETQAAIERSERTDQEQTQAITDLRNKVTTAHDETRAQFQDELKKILPTVEGIATDIKRLETSLNQHRVTVQEQIDTLGKNGESLKSDVEKMGGQLQAAYQSILSILRIVSENQRELKPNIPKPLEIVIEQKPEGGKPNAISTTT